MTLARWTSALWIGPALGLTVLLRAVSRRVRAGAGRQNRNDGILGYFWAKDDETALGYVRKVCAAILFALLQERFESLALSLRTQVQDMARATIVGDSMEALHRVLCALESEAILCARAGSFGTVIGLRGPPSLRHRCCVPRDIMSVGDARRRKQGLMFACNNIAQWSQGSFTMDVKVSHAREHRFCPAVVSSVQ